jgi:myosin heavy subunit
MSPVHRSLVLTGLVLLGALPQARAEAPKQDAALQQVLRKAQGALRQLSQEKAQLETDKTALQEQVKQLEARVHKLEPLQGEVERHRSTAASLQNANSGLENQLGTSRNREAQLHGKLKDIVAQAKQIQADNQLLVAAVKEREQWIGQCGIKNADLRKTGAELVERYQDKGFWDQLGELEPFTGIGKVKTETTVQDYHFKLQDLQVTPFEPQAQGEAPAAAAREPEAAPQAGAGAGKAEEDDEDE